MPCYDERTSPEYVRREQAGYIRELETALNAATRAACDLLKLMPSFDDGVWDHVSEGTIKWCKDHKQRDKKRKIR